MESKDPRKDIEMQKCFYIAQAILKGEKPSNKYLQDKIANYEKDNQH